MLATLRLDCRNAVCRVYVVARLIRRSPVQSSERVPSTQLCSERPGSHHRWGQPSTRGRASQMAMGSYLGDGGRWTTRLIDDDSRLV